MSHCIIAPLGIEGFGIGTRLAKWAPVENYSAEGSSPARLTHQESPRVAGANGGGFPLGDVRGESVSCRHEAACPTVADVLHKAS